jgi:diketogulonate reductase-like aldo/keto reductase
MEQRPFGPTQRAVAIIGQGTWQIEDDPRAQVIAALRLGLNLGMTHIDTAELYGAGIAEEIIAEAIAGRRDEVFLVSKVLPQNASRQSVLSACGKSLARLKTDRLDCYLLHWPGPHPLEETIGAFEQLMREGKTLSWGVSNFDVVEMEDALRIAGPGRIACNQLLYHLRERSIEHAVIPWCEKNDIAVVAYSPFGQNDFPGAATADGRVLQEIARSHGASVRQVALRFLLRHASVFAIPKAASPQHVRDNAGAAGLRLTDDDLARIDQAFPLGRPRRGVRTL